MWLAQQAAAIAVQAEQTVWKLQLIQSVAQWCVAFWFWGWSTCYSHKGVCPSFPFWSPLWLYASSVKNKMFPFCEKKNYQCPTSSSRGEANSAKASTQIKQTCNFHSFKTMACLQKKTVSLRGGVNSAKIAADPKHDLLVCWFLLLGI